MRYLIVLLVLLTAQLEAQEYFPGSSWRTGKPSEQGLDESPIRNYASHVKNGRLQPTLTSLLIIKNGYLVFEEYFGDYDGSQPHTLQSVTKSISSTLVGAAIQQGFIKSIDQSILSFFPEYDNVSNMNEHKQAMTLHHALTMRTGQDWTGESHLHPLNRYSGDKMKYVLDYKMETSPGKKWYYNSGIAILLGGLLQNATRMDTRDFAKQYLFDPIGATSAKWSWSHRGIPHTGGGLYLKPIDMARIGYLYLNDGRWNNNQIIPSWWVKEAFTRHVPHADDISGVRSIGYGYMWWVLPFEKKDTNSQKADIFMAYGHWGQFIFVIPAHNAVVVMTNNNSATYYDEIRPISQLYQYILPAFN